MSSRKQSGTTLLELLIAVTLVSLISLGMLMAMRVGLSAMSKSNDKLLANRRIASVQRIIESQVSGLMPMPAMCQGNPAMPFGFFEGRNDEMRFVSSYSLQEASRGYPRVLEYRVIPGERGEGVRLIVNELYYTGPASAGLLCGALEPDPDSGVVIPKMRPVEPGPGSFVIADRLAFCRILYRELLPAPALERWTPDWRRNRLPSAIRIEMAPLSSDPSRLQLSTITMPVRVNKWIGSDYVD